MRTLADLEIGWVYTEPPPLYLGGFRRACRRAWKTQVGRGSVLSRLGAELELRRCGSSLGPPSTGLQAPAGSQPLLSRVPGIGLQTWDQSNCPELQSPT